MRLLVCGGRDFSDTEHAYRVLDRLHLTHGIDVVIEGDARGADRIAGYWARKNGIDNLKFRADWASHGRAAGVKRNKQMLVHGKPDMVLAFPGGRGTADMVNRARAAGLPIQHEVLARIEAFGHDTEEWRDREATKAGIAPKPIGRRYP